MINVSLLDNISYARQLAITITGSKFLSLAETSSSREVVWLEALATDVLDILTSYRLKKACSTRRFNSIPHFSTPSTLINSSDTSCSRSKKPTSGPDHTVFSSLESKFDTTYLLLSDSDRGTLGWWHYLFPYTNQPPGVAAELSQKACNSSPREITGQPDRRRQASIIWRTACRCRES